MNILVVNNLLAALDVYLGLLAAMIVICVVFAIVALFIPKSIKKSKEAEPMQNSDAGELFLHESSAEPESAVDLRNVSDEEQVPTVKQVLGDAADEVAEEEPMESLPVEDDKPSYGGAEPVLTIEQIISEAENRAGEPHVEHRQNRQNYNKKKKRKK